MYISVHVPKTAGTTLAYLFDYGSGRKVLFDYNESDPILVRKCSSEFLAAKPFIEQNFKFIHGHFFVEKYQDIFPDAKFITCVRHPIDRIISQYYHVAREPSHPIGQKIRNHEMNIIEFVKNNPNIANAHYLFTGKKAIENYDFVFISENLIKSLAIFSQRFGFKRNDEFMNDGLPKMNVSPLKKQKTSELLESIPKVSEKEKEKLYELAIKDVHLYEKAKSIFLQ